MTERDKSGTPNLELISSMKVLGCRVPACSLGTYLHFCFPRSFARWLALIGIQCEMQLHQIENNSMLVDENRNPRLDRIQIGRWFAFPLVFARVTGNKTNIITIITIDFENEYVCLGFTSLVLFTDNEANHTILERTDEQEPITYA
jgi:hypothetical protein